MGSWGMGPAGSGGFGWLTPLVWLLVVAAVVLGAVYLYTRASGDAGPDGAMELLRERYARGEIGDEEFEERSSRLTGERSSKPAVE